ncbi:hypothetical protein EON68_02560, partial [archaeon]
SERITPLGMAMARLPLHPTFAKMCILAWQQQQLSLAAGVGDADAAAQLLDYCIALVAGMTVQEPFIRPSTSMLSVSGNDGANKTGHEEEEEEEEEAAADDDSDGDGRVRATRRGSGRNGKNDERARSRLLRELADEEANEMSPEGGDVAASAEDAAKSAEDAAAAAFEERMRAKRQAAANAAAAAHAKFRHPLSDALTQLRATGAHAYVLQSVGAAGAVNFCKSHYLRARAMREIQQLRRQLHGIVHSGLGSLTQPAVSAEEDAVAEASGASGDAAEAATAVEEEEVAQAQAPEGATSSSTNGKRATSGTAAPKRPPFRMALPPPSEETETLLRQLLAAGLLSNVAKRATPEQAAEVFASMPVGLRKLLTPYFSAATSLSEPLFVHPRSSVASSDPALAPAWLVYHEVLHSKRPYMRGVTIVSDAWLADLAAGTPLCTLDPPLDTPAPHYSLAQDAVLCSRVPVFGDRAWRLSPVLRPLP